MAGAWGCAYILCSHDHLGSRAAPPARNVKYQIKYNTYQYQYIQTARALKRCTSDIKLTNKRTRIPSPNIGSILVIQFRANMSYPLTLVRTNKCQNSVSAENSKRIRSLTKDKLSSTIMHKVHPSFKTDSSLHPQLLCRIPQRFRRSLIIRHS